MCIQYSLNRVQVFGAMPLAVRAFINTVPVIPPMAPPIACNPAQLNTPPHPCRIIGSIRKAPIIRPARAAEKIDIMKRESEPKSLFLNMRLYPLKKMITSNATETAKKPKKWGDVGLKNILIINATKPTNVAVPGFLTHHTATIKMENPIMSQRKGNLDI